MSKHLKYDKNAKIGFGGNFFNDNKMTAAEQTGFVYNVANGYRDRLKPIFANETKYLPNIKGSELLSSSVKRTNLPANIPSAVFPSTQSLTNPPHKQRDEILLQALLIGAGIYLVAQILD